MPGAGGHDERRGVLYGIAAYTMWGLFPLYFPLLEPAGPVEILSHRIVWSLATIAAILALGVGFRPLRRMLRDRRRVALLTAGAALIAVNWGVYIYAVNSEHVIEAALGYFVNPLVSVVFGLVVFRERLRPLQTAAVALGACAVVALTIDYGRLPWIALVLAVSFGAYGLVKKLADVGSAEGLTLETLVLLGPALGYLAVAEAGGSASFAHGPASESLLLASAGPVTAAPLLLFSASVTRIPLTVVGLLQYITPTLQFLVGLVLLGEAMPASRWIGFTLVWIALAVLSVDAIRAAQRSRAAAPPEPALA
ncbi:MAG TPA: EamA family transporter RarD [Thermoleophilaceae bacterium]|jgi:chloramphenicol-sensitive protein RarD